MAIGDILGNLLQAGAPIAGGFMGGPAGAAAGGLVGQAGGNILRDLFKEETPEDRARAQLLQRMQQPFQFQRVSFDPIAQQETRRFQQETVPGIAERFSGMGGQRSSAFGQQLGGAAGNLASRLAALRAQHDVGQQQMGMQARGLEQQRMGALQNMLAQQQGLQAAQQQSQQGRLGQMAGAFPGAILGQQQQNLAAQTGILGALRGQQQAAQQPLGQLMGLLQPALGQQFQPIGHAAQPGLSQQFMQQLPNILQGMAQAGLMAL